MTNQQGAPEALVLATLLDMAPETGIEPQTAEDASSELRRLHAENERLAALVEAQQPAPPAAAAITDTETFQNFHRLLCARFGYVHDERDWRRDQLSLVEHIARQAQPSPTPQADSQPAPDEIINMAREQGLPETETEGVFIVNADDLGRIFAAYRAARAPADSVTAPAGGVDAAVDAIALARYKVVPAHESMFHRFAVVAGDGEQQLYLGRETECQNMTRKFAGAFLDGAFYQSQIAAAPQPAAQAVRPAACAHMFVHFGTEQPRRRCNWCNELEDAAIAAKQGGAA